MKPTAVIPTRLPWAARVLALAVLAGFAPACSEDGDTTQSTKPDWQLVLNFEGAQFTFPLEVMNVFLVEDHAYPEIFEITGDGVSLVGAFPLDVHVDYGENWKLMIDVPIKISPSYSFGSDKKRSYITLPNGTELSILEGTFITNSVTGKYAGSDGDLTLSGTITVIVKTASDKQQLEGTFAVHCVSWG